MSHPRPPAPPSFGDILRLWRGRRRLSQLALACDAGVSQRHLSCVEQGRARASRDMALRLADAMDLPLRARNDLLLAAGHAPVFPEFSDQHRAMAEAMRMVDRIVAIQAPNPGIAVDRHWNILAANDAARWLMGGVANALLAAPINALRLSLHPDGLAPRIRNLRDWRDHVLHRLDRQIDASGDAVLSGLRDELARYPVPPPAPHGRLPQARPDALFVPLVLDSQLGPLSFITTTTVFGAPLDVGLSELAIESFLPADSATEAAMARVYSQLPISTNADQK
ncbi:MAG: helix-turn-helix transcriptional regulator [Paracoccaceae bacterium]|nr:MAG: helix-turn-helix transcriptional regulator [Paracoccaceae bacterium]